MQRQLFTFFFVFLFSSAKAQNNIDVLHYKYQIEITDNNDTIYGSAAIQFLVKEPVLFVNFDLADTRVNRKGMLVSSVIFASRNSLPPLIEHNNNKLRLTPAYGYKKGDTATVFITYKGIPSDGLIISKNQFGKRTFFADNWPNRAHNWIPCVDDPADKASVEFIVTVPSHYQVISNGVQLEETNLPGNKKLTHYKEDVPLPTKVMVIGVADFAVSTVGEVNCVPVYSWVYPENKKEGFFDYAIAKEILAYHINYIGAYPYKKLANVQSKTRFGGMENAGAIFYAEDGVNGLRQQEELLSHEIVHQWFGNMATEKSFAHLWLSEGFATYLTHIYIESKYGTDSLNNEMKIDRDRVIDFVKTSRRPVVDPTSNYMQLLNANSYQKGSWVLHMLRRQLGDSVFKKAIRLYYATYAGKNADTKDLQKIFETVSGKNLEQFFEQWLFTNENPNLQISWKYVEKSRQLSIKVKQLQKKIFSFPLELAIGTGHSKPQIKRLSISKSEETFFLPVGREASLASVDPFTSLLFEWTILKLK